jgi:hypothetical protein
MFMTILEKSFDSNRPFSQRSNGTEKPAILKLSLFNIGRLNIIKENTQLSIFVQGRDFGGTLPGDLVPPTFLDLFLSTMII